MDPPINPQVEPSSNTPTETPTAMDPDDLYGDSSVQDIKTESLSTPTTMISQSPPQTSVGIPGLFLLSDPPTERMDIKMKVQEDFEKTTEPIQHTAFSRDDFKFAVGTEDSMPTETQLKDPGDDSTTQSIRKSETPADTPMSDIPENPHLDTNTTFISAGLANKLTTTAEWELDSSSSASSASSTTSSEADSDEYDLLDPQSLAKLLMDEGDSDTERHTSSQGALKTKNEIPDEALPIPRPTIILTPTTQITHLGSIQNIIGTMVLIQASTPGDHKALNESSLLCFSNRKILGVVADTFGRVEEPLYTVRFNTPEEITETGASVGEPVYYVPEHSEYVFTAALKAVKGSDASNIFDEEVADAEREFSDDEKEAEAKRGKKNAKRRATSQVVCETDEPYVPLARPANLQEMLSAPPPPPGRGRGRNDRHNRGRGRGARGGRGRDNRDGRDNRGFESHRNNNDAPPPPPLESYNTQPYTHQFNPQYSPPPQQQWAPPPSLQQFHGYPQQHYPQYPQQQQQQQQQNFFQGTLPQGAHVNPAFFRSQQNTAWTPPVQQAQVQEGDALRALQNLLSLSKAAQGQGQGQGGV